MYKVGDAVLVKPTANQHIGFVPSMSKYLGELITISEVVTIGTRPVYTVKDATDGRSWWFAEEALAPASAVKNINYINIFDIK
jgi:hypothetical protein